MCLCAAFRSGRLDHLPWGGATDAAFLGLACIIAIRGTFAALPLMAVIVVGLAYGRGTLAAALSTRPAIILGEVSYSLYMVHLLTMEIVYAPINHSRFYGSLEMRVATLPIALAAVAIATILVYRTVEVPFRRRTLAMLAGGPAVTAR